jgi:hypothetical protein
MKTRNPARRSNFAQCRKNCGARVAHDSFPTRALAIPLYLQPAGEALVSLAGFFVAPGKTESLLFGGHARA